MTLESIVITLTLLHPSNTTALQDWTFDDESMIRVGRAMDNNVVLYSAVVSRRHVEIRRLGSDWELENLGANGTFLNGKPITKTSVIDGMVVQLATSGPQIKIRITADDTPAKLLLNRLESPANDRGNHDKETMVS